MLQTQRLIQCRTELKFLLASHEIVHFLACLGPALSNPRFRHHLGRITTVYFDRPDGMLARKALRSPGCNLKLRLREYFTPEGIPSSMFIWIEIKERNGVKSLKNRFELPKRLVAGFLRGEVGEAQVLGFQSPLVNRERVVESLRKLREIAAEGELVAAGAVSYRRLALEGGTPLSRLTLDQDITYHRSPVALYESTRALDRDALGPVSLEEKAAIVEVKHRGTVAPMWCRRALGAASPVEYSKFQVLSALTLSHQVAD